MSNQTRIIMPTQDSTTSLSEPRKPCKHCQKVPSNRPRGLCWSCYYRPGVREQYAIAANSVKKSATCLSGEQAAPTRIRPGPDKVAVMVFRASLGMPIFCDDDAASE